MDVGSIHCDRGMIEQKYPETTQVSRANTDINNITMMVEAHHADIAYGTVMRGCFATAHAQGTVPCVSIGDFSRYSGG